MEIFDLKVARNDDVTHKIEVTKDDVPVDISGYTTYLTVRTEAQMLNITSETNDVNSVFQVITTAHTNPSAGLSTIYTSKDNNNINPSVKYFYDIQLKTGSGEIVTPVSGRYLILADVTRTT